MHEHSVMNGLVRQVLQAAEEAGAARVVRVKVSLGPWSSFTPEHLRSHFGHAVAGTPAEGAAFEVTADNTDAADSARFPSLGSSDFVLEEVEVE
jgi:Zn finger protein HypA/HybF involved in hydrogenase expression